MNIGILNKTTEEMLNRADVLCHNYDIDLVKYVTEKIDLS